MNHTGLPQAPVINFSRDGEMVHMNDDAGTKVSTIQIPSYFAVPQPSVEVLKPT
jgi:hypothetical protein